MQTLKILKPLPIFLLKKKCVLRQQLEKANVGLDYRLPLSEESDLKIKVYGMKNILNFHASTYETLSEELDFFTEAAYTYDFGGINIITFGISGDYGVLDQSSIGSRNAATRSLFAQDIFDLLGSWIFTALPSFLPESLANSSAFLRAESTASSLAFDFVSS